MRVQTQGLVVVLLAVLLPQSSRAVPAAVIYSGRLTNRVTAQALPDGTYDLVFRLHREGNQTGSPGDVIFVESFTGDDAIQVSAGAFQAVLDDNEDNTTDPRVLGVNDAFALYDTLFVSVEINGVELGSPQRIGAAAWATRVRNDCQLHFDLEENTTSTVTYWPNQETQVELLSRGWLCWNATATYAQLSPHTSGVPLLQRYEFWGAANKTCGRITVVSENWDTDGVGDLDSGVILVRDVNNDERSTNYYGLRFLKGGTGWHGAWRKGTGAPGTGAGGGYAGGAVPSGRWTLWTCD